jgi:hypothetical protein
MGRDVEPYLRGRRARRHWRRGADPTRLALNEPCVCGTSSIAAALKLIEGCFVSETPSRIARRLTPVDHDDAPCGGRRSARLHSPRFTGAPARHCAVAPTLRATSCGVADDIIAECGGDLQPSSTRCAGAAMQEEKGSTKIVWRSWFRTRNRRWLISSPRYLIASAICSRALTIASSCAASRLGKSWPTSSSMT